MDRYSVEWRCNVRDWILIDGAVEDSVERFGLRTKDWGKWGGVKERLACETKTIVEQAGTRFAFPSRSLYLGNAGNLLEIFASKRILEQAADPTRQRAELAGAHRGQRGRMPAFRSQCQTR